MRALSNQVVIKTREDLEEPYAPPCRIGPGGIEPRPFFGEVVSVGKGDQLHPDIPELRKGDIVLWNLAKMGLPGVEHGRAFMLNSFNSLLARVDKVGTKDEEITAILDMVLTVEDPDMMARQISSALVLPQSVVRDGMQEAKGSPVAAVWERVLSVGKGITFAGRTMCARCKDHLQRTEVPDIRRHDLVCFNPAWSVDWRRGGRNLRFTPYSEIRAVAED
jgi:hypothetical protein